MTTATVLNNQLTLVSGDDWQGLYVGDALVDEGHRIAPDSLVHYARISTDFVKKEVKYSWISELGQFPQSLSDVEFI